MKTGFNTQQYIDEQTRVFSERMAGKGDCFLEFGGKPFGDEHASRVLPGYEPDCKGDILENISNQTSAKVVMVVNALDIIPAPDGRTPNGRIRGDSGLRYDMDTIRLIQESLDRNIAVENLVLSATPFHLSTESEERMGQLGIEIERLGVKIKKHRLIAGYPKSVDMIYNDMVWEENDSVYEAGRPLITISPGGGSGKFSVLLSEMRKALSDGHIPNYIKFETFPAFHLDHKHPLNLAFESATADLGNKVLKLSDGSSGYDKDEYNFLLLCALFKKYGKSNLLKKMKVSSDMGVNMIHRGITDDQVIIEACYEEVKRRVRRYKNEHSEGNETKRTIARAIEIEKEFEKNFNLII